MKKDRLATCQRESPQTLSDRILPEETISQPIRYVGIVLPVSEIHIRQETLRKDRAEFAKGGRDAVAGASEAGWEEFGGELVVSLFFRI
jgi:hypothetical protein